MDERYYICHIGKIKKIGLNDEVICSSKIIFVTVQTRDGGNIDIQMVRELHPEFYQEFDQLWELVEKGEEEIVDAEVRIIQYNNYYPPCYTISLSTNG